MNIGGFAELGVTVDSSGVRKGDRDLQQFSKTAGSATKATDVLANSAKLATGALAAIGVGTGVSNAISTIIDFDEALASLRAISGATAKEMDQLSKQARQLGATTKYGANEAAQAQTFLAQAGLKTNQVLGATPKVLQLAQAGMLGLGEAADLATDIMSQMGLGIQDLGRLNDVLVKTANLATTNVSQLGQGFSYAAPLASNFGLTLEEVSGALGTISNSGIKAGRAGTGLMGVLRQLSNVTPQNAKTLQAYGVTLDQLDIKTRGFDAVLQTLAEANISAADSVAIFGSESVSAGLALTRGLDGYRSFTEELKNAEGAAKNVALVMSDSIVGAFKNLASATQESFLQLGDAGLAGGLKSVATMAAGVINTYNGLLPLFAESNGLNKEQEESIANVAQALKVAGGILAANIALYSGYTAAVTAATVATRLFNAVVKANPLVLIASLLASTIGLLWAYRDATVTVGETNASVGEWIIGVWNVVSDRVSKVWNTLIGNLKKAFSPLVDKISNNSKFIYETWSSYVVGMLDIWKGTVNAFIGLFKSIADVGWEIATSIYDSFATTFDNILNRGKAFKNDLVAVLDGDFSFANTHGFTPEEDPLVELGSRLKNIVVDNASTDYAAQLGQAFSDMADDVEESVWRSQIKLGVLDDYLLITDETAGDTSETIEDLGNSLNTTSTETEKAKKEAEKFAGSLQTLLDKLYPLEATQREYLKDQIALQTALINGTLTTKEYFDALSKLPTLYESASEFSDDFFGKIEKGSKKAATQSEELAKSWEESAKRIDETFADAFTGAFDSFSDFSSELIDGFKRTLGEMAYQATLKPIVLSITAGAASGLGIGGAAASGGGAGSSSDLLGIGKSLFKGVSDGFSSVAWTGQAGGYTSGFGASATGGGGLLSGGSLGNFSGMTGLASLGGGLLGGMGGRALGSSLFGKDANSQIGSMLGAGVGTFFGGPVGALAGGAIGGLVDSLFGSGREQFIKTRQTRRDSGSNWYRDYNATTQLGDIGIRDKQKVDPQPLKDWVAAVESADNALAAILDDSQLEAVRSELGQEKNTKGTDLASVTKDRYERAFQAIASESNDIVKKLIGEIGDISADTINEQFGQLESAIKIGNVVEGLSGNIKSEVEDAIDKGIANGDSFDSIATTIASSVAVLEQFAAVAETIGLEFDKTAKGALKAANSMAVLAGGIDNLTALQENYLKLVYTQAEQDQMMRSNVQKQIDQFNELNSTSVQTKSQLREFVDSLDLTTVEGQKAYVSALNVASAFAKLEEVGTPLEAALSKIRDTFGSAVDSATEAANTAQENLRKAYDGFMSTAYDQQLSLLDLMGDSEGRLALERQNALEGMDESLKETQKRIWALQDEKEALDKAKEASAKYYDELSSAKDYINDFSNDIERFVKGLRADNLGGASSVGINKSSFEAQYKKAMGGDRDALSSITQYANDYISSAQGKAGSYGEAQAIALKIASQLEDLPKLLSPEEFISEEFAKALREQTKSISANLAETLTGPNPSNIAKELSGYFDVLAGGIDGVLTREQLAIVMKGKATDAQIDLMMRMMDLNGDNIVDKLESVVIKSMPTDGVLANALGSIMKANGAKQLTESQVYKALSPIATDAEIAKLISTVDVNGDGILTEQEITNQRIRGLASGIGGSLKPMFDDLDSSVDGLLNYSEFKNGFEGMATDEQLKQIFNALDINGDGTIDKLEAVKASTDKVGGNTIGLEKRAGEQLGALNEMIDEMQRSTDQYIDLNSNLKGLAAALQTMGIAQKELAEIQKRQQAAEAAAKQRVELERKVSNLESRIDSAQNDIEKATDKRNPLYDERNVAREIEKQMNYAKNNFEDMDKVYKGIKGYIGDENAYWDGNTLKFSGNSDERNNIKELYGTMRNYLDLYSSVTGKGDEKKLQLDETDWYGAGNSKNNYEIEYGGKTYKANNVKDLEDIWLNMEKTLNDYYGTDFSYKDLDSADQISKDISSYNKEIIDARNTMSSLEKEIAKLTKEIGKLKSIEQFDGSHATGLNYVPFDGYNAELHRGEMVVTAAQAPGVRSFLNGDLDDGQDYSMQTDAENAVIMASTQRGEETQELRKANKEIATLRDDLNRAMYALAKSNSKMARIMDRWDFDGVPEQRDLENPQ